MKTLLTILFFIATTLLVMSSYLILHLIDSGRHHIALVTLLIMVPLLILFMAYFLSRYMKYPPGDNHT